VRLGIGEAGEEGWKCWSPRTGPAERETRGGRGVSNPPARTEYPLRLAVRPRRRRPNSRIGGRLSAASVAHTVHACSAAQPNQQAQRRRPTIWNFERTGIFQGSARRAREGGGADPRAPHGRAIRSHAIASLAENPSARISHSATIVPDRPSPVWQNTPTGLDPCGRERRPLVSTAARGVDTGFTPDLHLIYTSSRAPRRRRGTLVSLET
jgi:hypothetical protein